MERSSSRKKHYARDDSKKKIQEAAIQEVLPGYEEYLVLLQERNRLLKRLRKKSKSQIEQEKKEKGFSIYVNGANSGHRPVNVKLSTDEPKSPSPPPKSHRLKTAGDVVPRRALNLEDLEMRLAEEKNKMQEKNRGKTAPARERRRNWMMESVDIKTSRGERCKLKAPVLMTGNYDDDFDSDDGSGHGSDYDSIDEEEEMKMHMSAYLTKKDSDDEEEERERYHRKSKMSSQQTKESKPKSKAPPKTPTKSPPKSKSAPRAFTSEDEEEIKEQLTLSVADVKKLRQSLSMNASIKESLAREVSSEEEFSDRESPIPEEDEVEEDLVPSMDKLSISNNKKPVLKPTDTIVLELSAPPQSKGKIEKNLSMARRKDADTEVRLSNAKTPRSKSAVNLPSNGQSNKKNRPLSANRISQEQKTDSTEETSAVLAALKAENEKAAKEIRAASVKKLPPKKSPTKRPESPLRRSGQSSKNDDIRRSTPSSQRPKSGQGHSDVSKSKDGESFLANDRLANIMKKVLLMQPRQQKHLMKVLSKIEDSVDVKVSTDGPVLNKPVKATNVPVTTSSKPVKATQPVTEMVSPSSDRHSSDPSDDEDENQDGIEVNVEMRSNWGHQNLMGLTEIRFFDGNNHPVPITTKSVSLHGNLDYGGSLDTIFNGKTKTNKERNMWCCRFRKGQPVELCITLPKIIRGKLLELSRIKVWNYNKSINELDIGVKDMRIFVGGVLIYDGVIDKGCGNQVFDYGVVINCQEDKSPVDSESSPLKCPVPQEKNSSPVFKKSVTSPRSSKDSTGGVILQKPSLSPRSKIDYNKKSSAGQFSNHSANDEINRKSALQDDFTKKTSCEIGKKPFEELSKKNPVEELSKKPPIYARLSSTEENRPQSGSSNSSNENNTVQSVPKSVKDSKVRSETRTMTYADKDLRRPSISSDRSGSDLEDDRSESKMPHRHRGSKTPRKSKRMAAKLDGHSSEEGQSSRSVNDSSDQKPPRPTRTSEDKSLSKSNERKEKQPDNSVEVSHDDVPMIQQLKEMNLKEQKRKKEIPKWLKPEDVPVTSENRENLNIKAKPPKSQEPKQKMSQLTKKDDHMFQSRQEDVDMLIDEEMAMWPTLMGKKTELKTVFDKEDKDVKKDDKNESDQDKKTPLQKIQQNRAKWRENQKKNLEESWGSLNKFDRHQKGRISMDLDDDALDEYLKPLQPVAPEPTIVEETETVPQHPAIQDDNWGSDDEDSFTIPTLPQGRDLMINIKTTWGDKHYVGLTGIELFSSTGHPVSVTKITAVPLDINELDEYNKDPRVVTNLTDGVNRTRDDVHMWLAPFTSGGNHFIYVTFDKPCKLALMRIWNYNKSRIHSYRGAKDVEITLDGSTIFKGEIARACGGIEGGTEAFGDNILFTTDEEILEAVSKHDDAYEGDLLDDDEPHDVPFERPRTADEGDDTRPFTRAQGNLKPEKDVNNARPATGIVTEAGDVLVYKGKCLELNFTETWGDLHYLGLTGLEVVGKEGEALPLKYSMLTANPKDLHSLPGHEKDDRTLDKVCNDTNVTVSDEHMWLIPFTEGNNHTLQIDFGQSTLVAGLRIWNYNKSPEDTFRGAKIVHVTIDGRQLSPPEGYLIRKGPGNCHFDFAQEISFSPQEISSPTHASKQEHSAVRSSLTSDEASQEYETGQMPCGFIYQLQLMSTWGDPYYVGLNGIEFYDASFNKIELTENNISAYPDSVNVLGSVQNDVRTPDKLIDGELDTMDGQHMWLAPILPTILNRVYVIFDLPTTVSMIKIWNYSKSPQRGAKEFALLVDDLLVYNGILQAATSGAKGILPHMDAPQRYHTIIFTDNKEVLRREKHTVISNKQAGEQDIQLTNDKKVVAEYNDPKRAKGGKPVNQELRPKTSVPGPSKKFQRR